MLKIYNTLARDKQVFTPIVAGKVSMYVCGMTVYDYCHLGHARVMVVFDMVSRWLRTSGYDVTYVRNITDIDDKIIKRANENNETIHQLTQRFIEAMDEDSAKLGVIRPDIEPKATDFIDGMLGMIGALIEKGFAYPASNGDVYYSVNSFEGYGKLSGKSLEDLSAGERVEIDTHKKDAMDFVLWKAAKPNEPSWDSPWGKGRPGWHIECSAMSAHHLGQHFDIHGGGQDLQFPHHENEIAQSCAACGTPFVHVWMHKGFVRVNDEKMSKSLGNFFTVREVLKTLRDPEVLRFFLLSSHYRGPINYSTAQLAQADETLLGLYRALKDAGASGPVDAQWLARFRGAMDDDFNTPEALAAMQGVAKELNQAKAAGNSPQTAAAAATLRAMSAVLGVLQQDPDSYLKRSVGEKTMSDTDIETLLAARQAARAAKNFAESDRIRGQLTAAGILLEDKAGGATQWRRA